jgi:hypothetical protein
MANVNEGLSGGDYSGDDASDINTEAGWDAAMRAKVAGKQSNDSTTTSTPVEEKGERYDPDSDSAAQIKQEVLADVPTTDLQSALKYGKPALEPEHIEQETTFENFEKMNPDEQRDWAVQVEPDVWKAQQAQAANDRASVLHRELLDAYEAEPLSNTDQFRALLEDDADTADPVIRAAANYLQGAPEAAEEQFEQWIAEAINEHFAAWDGDPDTPDIADTDTEAGAILAQARDLIAEERAQVERLADEENRTRAQSTAYEGSKQAAKAWAREQGIRSSTEADARIAAADNFLQSELGVSLEALAFQHPGIFKEQLTFADAALRGIESEDRVQRFKSQIMDSHTTNVAAGLESSADRLERLLKRIAPDPSEPSREIDKAMARAEARANGHSQTAASIKASLMNADAETAVKDGFTVNGRKVSQEEAAFDPKRAEEARRERMRAAGIR